MALRCILFTAAAASLMGSGSAEFLMFADHKCQKPIGRIAVEQMGGCQCAMCARPPSAVTPLIPVITKTSAELENAPQDAPAEDTPAEDSPAESATLVRTITLMPTLSDTIYNASHTTVPSDTPTSALATVTSTLTLTLPTVTRTVTATLPTATSAGSNTLSRSKSHTLLPDAAGPSSTRAPTRTGSVTVPTYTSSYTDRPPVNRSTGSLPVSVPLPHAKDILSDLSVLKGTVQCTPCIWPSALLASPRVPNTPKVSAGYLQCEGPRKVRMRLFGNADDCDGAEPELMPVVEFEPYNCTNITDTMVDKTAPVYAAFAPALCMEDKKDMTDTEMVLMMILGGLILCLLILLVFLFFFRKRLEQLRGAPQELLQAQREEQELMAQADEVRKRSIKLSETLAKQRGGIELAV
eukprot:Hpha_TRINITY_DN15571_c2_g7::TRINITY_DN15571_c2_g7_i1::g.106256::m.106256